VLVKIQTLILLQRQNFALVSCCDRDSPTLIRLQQQIFCSCFVLCSGFSNPNFASAANFRSFCTLSVFRIDFPEKKACQTNRVLGPRLRS
jgi:hypothetical protein